MAQASSTTPEDARRSATADAAVLLRQDALGTLAPGKIAPLI
ncbi:hypothetical protein ABZ234_15165 [Nocardiopsis sp. NPDC006198]